MTRTPIDINRPEPGYYETVLVKGGRPLGLHIAWEYGARETCEACEGDGCDKAYVDLRGDYLPCDECSGQGSILASDDVLRAWQDGEEVSAYQVWPRCAGKPIDEARYQFLLKDSEFLQKTNHPEADPRRPIDINKTRTPF